MSVAFQLVTYCAPMYLQRKDNLAGFVCYTRSIFWLNSFRRSADCSMSRGRVWLIRWTGLVAIAASGILLMSCGSSSTNSMTPPPPLPVSNCPFLGVLGASGQHTGNLNVSAQELNTQLADIGYDPFVA